MKKWCVKCVAFSWKKSHICGNISYPLLAASSSLDLLYFLCLHLTLALSANVT